MSIWLLLIGALAASTELEAPLDLGQVLRSVEEHHPKMRVAELKVAAAQGSVLEKRGAFDLRVGASVGGDPLGFYDSFLAKVELRQTLPWYGIDLSAGYRIGDDFPIYEAKKQSSDEGEFFAQVDIPLLKDGLQNPGRLALKGAKIGVEEARAGRDQIILDLKVAATFVYWDWIQAGHSFRIYEELLDIASQRLALVKAEADGGQRPAIDIADNQRLVYERQSLMLQSQLKFQRAAIKLSMYYRNAEGLPQIASPSRLPAQLELQVSPDAQNFFDEGIEYIVEAWPDIVALDRKVEALRVDEALYKNKLLPKIDISSALIQDFGVPTSYGPDEAFKTKNETELLLSLKVESPIPARQARGKLASIRSKLLAFENERALKTQGLTNRLFELEQTITQLRSATDFAERSLALAVRLEEAERRKYSLGQSNLIFVNTREGVRAKAGVEVLKNRSELNKAWAQVLAILSPRAELGK